MKIMVNVLGLQKYNENDCHTRGGGKSHFLKSFWLLFHLVPFSPIQNQLLKVFAGKDYLFSTDKLHVEFELLKVKDIKEQEVLAFVYNFFSNSLPPVLMVILKP